MHDYDYQNIIFLLILVVALYFFISNLRKIISNIKLGRDINRSDNRKLRFKNMFRVAMGQSKMFDRPIAAILHLFVYIGFIIINIEVIEILIDGVFGTHRFLAHIINLNLYNFLIASFEILAFLVIFSCIIFLIRRNIIKIMRFRSKEMTKWPKTDANLILIFEILLMTAFLIMNTADSLLQIKDQENYFAAGLFPISSNLVFLFDSFSVESLFIIERFTWWFHILGILLFMNYVLISKHLHIFFAFPSTYFANINNLGKIDNLVSVTNEVKLMLDPNTDPYSSQSLDDSTIEKLPQLFGARDATDLNWVQLLNSYSCTECGRCSSVCPANQTGKLLSPRKIMMDTRDRIEEIGKNNDNNDQKFLLGDYITNEEIWACTTCNACTDACPIDLDPLSIIVDLRRYLVMEESSAPTELNNMFSNIENNGAPWQFPASDRLKWLDNN
jgi:heterodisulfide reductase subunit C|tara:strand:- start:11550 stop:12881 length:1332 start_codon:yes stop_codon:yes gene_type:complete